jgi:2-oxoglutarate dehydrogenase E2 component (dihydrolipoamide succinyltransferase)
MYYIIAIEFCRRCYYLPNPSPYQVWSRSFASDNGKPQ